MRASGTLLRVLTEAAQDALKAKTEFELNLIGNTEEYSRLYRADEKEWRANGYKVVEGMEKEYALCGTAHMDRAVHCIGHGSMGGRSSDRSVRPEVPHRPSRWGTNET